jgi:hypothetical protein
MNVVPMNTGSQAKLSTSPIYRGDVGWEGVWFGIVPGKAAIDPRLTNGAVRCLLLMASWGRQDTKGRPERKFSIAQTTLANRLGRPRQTVNRWIKLLCKCGYLEMVGRTRRPGGGWGANVYRIVGYDIDVDAGKTAEDAQAEPVGYMPSAKTELAVSDDSSAFKSGET